MYPFILALFSPLWLLVALENADGFVYPAEFLVYGIVAFGLTSQRHHLGLGKGNFDRANYGKTNRGAKCQNCIGYAEARR